MGIDKGRSGSCWKAALAASEAGGCVGLEGLNLDPALLMKMAAGCPHLASLADGLFPLQALSVRPLLEGGHQH